MQRAAIKLNFSNIIKLYIYVKTSMQLIDIKIPWLKFNYQINKNEWNKYKV